jgi:uncharacterized protein (DUF58 family)
MTRAGRWFAFPTILFASYGAVSIINMQGYVIFCYMAAFWILAAAGMLVFRPKVKVTPRYAPRVCAGETMPVDIEVEQLGRLSQVDLFVLVHNLPNAVDAEPDDGVALPPLRRGQRATVRLGIRCNKRGLYKLRGFRVESGFPFGLFRSSRTFAQDAALIVYPRFQPLGRMELPTGMKHHPGGVMLASTLGESFEFIGDREYREGDNIRDIDWRASARLNHLIVREYREEYFMRVAVILDTHVPRKAEQGAHDNFERAVSVTASVADYMARQDYLVDIFAAGPNLYHLTAGRSLAYLDQILDILAAVDENPEEPFATIEPQLMQNLAQITTIICVFLDWNEARRAFGSRLASMGCGVRLIIVRDGDPSCDPMLDANVIAVSPTVTRQMYETGLNQL